MSNTSRTLFKVIATAAVIVVCACTVARAERVNIAAVVNDTVITSTDLHERRDLIMAMNNVPMTAENQQRITPRILQALIDEALQLEEARRHSITVSDEDIEKAIAASEEDRGQAPGAVLAQIAQRDLSKRSLYEQLRANIAWTRVVQRKLRRNVSVAEDEVIRAQETEAAHPGINEVRVAAIVLPVRKPEDAGRVATLAETMSREISEGVGMKELVSKYAKEGLAISPPRWIPEESLQPALQQAMRALQPNQVTPPLGTPEGYQMLQLLGRRITKPLPDTTEVVLKDIRMGAPPVKNKEEMEQLRQQTLAVRANPGDCMNAATGEPGIKVETGFVRTQMGALPPEMRSVVDNLSVGGISEPLLGQQTIRLVMLCEKIEPASAAFADAEKVRQTLFTQKLELEAAKRMRDLRRDAFIDIKGLDAS